MDQGPPADHKTRLQVDQIVAYLQGLLRCENGRLLYERYQTALEQVTPRQVFMAYHTLYAGGTEVSDLLDILDKSINVFHAALKTEMQVKTDPVGLADYLCRENDALLLRLDQIRNLLMQPTDHLRSDLLQAVHELQLFDAHYLKKENVLFPYLEQKTPYFQGLGIMWALHDEIRLRLRQAVSCLSADDCPEQERNRILGSLIFGMHGMVHKEALILLPAADDVLTADDWQDMLLHSRDFFYPFIDPPDLSEPVQAKQDKQTPTPELLLQTETGSMTLAEVEQVFAALPVDLTFIDTQNKVRFFTRPKQRIFPRSTAIIGRAVENCHPPQSIDRVLEIVSAFRSGSQDRATFWIRLKGRLILIQYFAVRDRQQQYMGTLEVSQDITAWQQLDGERRLLSWSAQENSEG